MSTFPITLLPTTIPGLHTWIDFADTSTITATGNAVSAVRNKANSQITLTQPNAINQPISGVRTINGLNVIDFDGINDFMQFSTNKVVSEPFTLFTLAQVDGAAGQTIMGSQTSATAGQWTLIKNGGFAIFQPYAFGSGGAASGGVHTYNSSPNIHTVSLANGQTIKYQLNNGAISADVVLSGYDNAVATALCIGASTGASAFLDGAIGEIIVYGSVLSTTDITRVNRYLANKWALAI